MKAKALHCLHWFCTKMIKELSLCFRVEETGQKGELTWVVGCNSGMGEEGCHI